MHIKKIKAHFAFLIFVSNINTESSESNEYGAGSRTGLRPYSRDLFFGAAAHEYTEIVISDALPDESYSIHSNGNHEVNPSDLLPEDMLESYQRGTLFDTENDLKRRMNCEDTTVFGQVFENCNVKKLKSVLDQHNENNVKSTKHDGSHANSQLTGFYINLDYKKRLKIQFESTDHNIEHDATNVQGNTAQESANRVIYYKLSESNPRSLKDCPFLDELQPPSAFYTYVLPPTVSNRSISILSRIADSQSYLDFGKYRDKIMTMLVITNSNPKSETETVKSFKKFNIWLIPKDQNQLENFCRLYYRIANLKNFKGAGETAVTKVIFGPFKNFQAKYKSAWFKSAHIILTKKSSQPNVATNYIPQNTDTVPMEVESIENFFSVFFDEDKRITQGYSIVSIYSAIKIAFFILKTSYIDYVIKQNACKIIYYMPEILVFMDWRMNLLDYTPSDEKIYEEIDHIKNIIIQFVDTQTEDDEAAVSKLETTIKKFRYIIKKIVDDTISCGIIEIHLYTFGLESKYSRCTKAKNAKMLQSFSLSLHSL